MKAIGYRKALPVTDPDALIDIELATPTDLRPHDLLVAVEAVSVNPVDTKVRRGVEPPADTAKVIGYDAAGTVEAVGSEVTLFQPGDEVFYAGTRTRPGTNSEFHLVDERLVGRKPATLSFAEAAALPLTAVTAWELLFDRMRLPYGVKTQTGALLIVGASGGVGSIMTQLARRLTGLTVIGTASRPETTAWVKKMGAHHVIDHRLGLKEALAGIGLDKVDFIAGLTATKQHLPAIIEIIAPQGRFGLIDDPDVLDIVKLKQKSVSVSWEFMFTRSDYETPDMIEQHRILNEIADLVDAGLLVSTMTEDAGRITADNLKRVHALVESGKTIGKAVLSGF